MILKICDWIILYSLIFLVTLTPIVINPWGDDQFRLPKEVFAQIMIIIAFSSWVIKLLEKCLIPPHPPLIKGDKRGILSIVKKIISETPLMLPISLLILASTLSLINSASVLFSFKSIINIVLYSLLYIIIINNVKKERQIKILLISALLSGIITSIYCLIQYFGFDPITHTVNPAQPNIGSYRTTGFLDNPDVVSGYLVILPTIALALFITSKNLFLKILFFSSFILITFLIILIHSVAPILGLLTAFIIFTVFVVPRINFKWKVSLIALLLLSSIGLGVMTNKPSTILGRILSLYKGFQNLSSDRLLMWRTAGEMVKDKPILGIGMGMYKVRFFEYRDRVLEKIPYLGVYEKSEQVHNEYLQLCAEMGTLGIIAAIWLIVNYFVFTLKSLKAHPPICKGGNKGGVEQGVSQLNIIGLISGVTAILIDAIGSFPFHIAPSAVISVVLIALTVSLTFSSALKEDKLYISSPLGGED